MAETSLDRDDIAMLALKLRANRPGRDTRDIRLLLAFCGIDRLEDAEELYEEFYPGDTLDPRAERIVVAVLDGDTTGVPQSPGAIDI